MRWLVCALLAPLVFSIVNFGDKYIIERHIRDAWAMPIYSGMIAFLTGCVLFVLTGFPALPLRDAVLVIVTGAMTSLGAALYFYAIGRDEASKIIVLIQMQPVMVLVLALIFLNETISAQQFLGFVLILGAAVAVSLNRGEGRFGLSASFWIILLVDLIWSSSVVLFKFVAVENDFAALLPYESWGLAFGDVGLYLFVPSIRRAFHENLRIVSRQALGFLMVNESIFVVAKLLTLTAVALGPVALVSVLGSTQVFFGVLLGAILTSFAPAIFKEDISRQNLARKAALALLMFGGIVLVG